MVQAAGPDRSRRRSSGCLLGSNAVFSSLKEFYQFPHETQGTEPKAGRSPESTAELVKAKDSQADQRTKTGRDSDFIGLNQSAAEALAEKRGLRHCVASVEGKSQMGFMDNRPSRINFWLEKRKVVKTTRG